MAEFTQNFNLEKPTGNENFRRQVLNDNMDKIDAAIAARETPAGAQAKVNAALMELYEHQVDYAPHIIALSTIDSNLEYAGDVTKEVLAVSCNVGDLLYLSTAGYNKAQANTTATIPCTAMCLEDGTGEKKILKHGYIMNTAWNAAKGALAYVSPATAGAVTTTRPSAAGQQLQIVGYFVTPNILYFNPQLVVIEI